MGNGINFEDIMKKARESGENGELNNEKGIREFADKSLTPEKAAVLKSVLSDETKLKTILESDAAKALFEKLSGGTRNG